MMKNVKVSILSDEYAFYLENSDDNRKKHQYERHDFSIQKSCSIEDMSSNGSSIAIPSTGQTFYDLTCLINLFNIYTHGDSNISFVPQSFVNPQYIPITATTTAYIVSGLTMFVSTLLLMCQIIMRFDSHTLNVPKHNPFRQGRLLLEDYAILIGYVCLFSTSKYKSTSYSNIVCHMHRSRLWRTLS